MFMFEVGKTYGGRSAVHSMIYYYFNVVSRTNDAVTVEWMRKNDDRGNEVKTFPIHVVDGCEVVYPFEEDPYENKNNRCTIKASWGKQ